MNPPPSPVSIPLVEVGATDFEARVLQSARPVLVVFGAPWSKPCQSLERVMERIAAERAGSVGVVKVNADLHPDLSVWYEVQSLPTVVLFREGCPRSRVVGTASKERVLDLLQGLPETGARPADAQGE
ncbi:MAG: thiol reductase thioredoxin [Verrucomicrobiales bacterium]|nr:thiol reductase thioredoxin [Verrucomicrobiales bacterium]